jgi:hypothetical protein
METVAERAASCQEDYARSVFIRNYAEIIDTFHLLKHANILSFQAEND